MSGILFGHLAAGAAGLVFVWLCLAAAPRE